MLVGQRDSMACLEKEQDKIAGGFWFHASSLGEFEQGRRIMESVRQQWPAVPLLLTFYSPSGYEVRKNYQGADEVCYLPFDTPNNVQAFLDVVRPRAAFFIKYEFWPNYLQSIKERHIPCYLVSGIFRSQQLFFKPWGGFFRQMLTCFDALFVQNEASRELLATIGVKEQVHVCGDTRCDQVLAVAAESKQLPTIESFVKASTNQTIVVAGSTWPKDEALLLAYFNEHPRLKLIIAPHEIHESHLQSIESALKRPYLRYSQLNETNAASVDCLIIDCFGLLSSLYRYGQLAYVGGGFGAGIHNTLEAAVYGIPILFGPRFQKFDEAKGLLADGAAKSIQHAQELSDWLDAWSSDDEARTQAGKAAKTYVGSHSGGSQYIVDHLIHHQP